VQSKTQRILARAVEITPDALVLILEGKSVSIPGNIVRSGLHTHRQQSETGRCYRLGGTVSIGR